MKFKNYLKSLNQLLKDHPECGDFDVIYATDGEGNCYMDVQFEGSIGYYDEDYTPLEYFEQEEIVETPNVVCIN